ncbi:VanW family protein [Anaerorhabdus furcosa]|uniref:Vancomycin resistance protein VanW n=1 Tax=Anaerorhabdus furcosa TaxID=118967 RepID=A0A1T4LI68_9FIRM|nr:VanW family protein [Anaerorhabdus furcosa]SJZ54257.1 vancomycin resistance protein VanW [Anaerorhabdus furcosa]
MRKLFCEISPVTYKISITKERTLRSMKDHIHNVLFAQQKSEDLLPIVLNKHNSLIRRRLGNVNMELQENKFINLSLSTPKINKICIRPNEVFSFWKLVGNPVKRKGYKEGLTISSGKATSGIGGGMCQFTNLIHWMVLHTSLTIIEHHHHDAYDLFPDFNRQIPFGTGTSIMYNYLDYRFKNETDKTYQIVVYMTDEYLCGEMRCDKKEDVKYHIVIEDEYFSKENGNVYRNGKVYRKTIDVCTGNCIKKECIRVNHAKVLYDTSNLKIKES